MLYKPCMQKRTETLGKPTTAFFTYPNGVKIAVKSMGKSCLNENGYWEEIMPGIFQCSLCHYKSWGRFLSICCPNCRKLLIHGRKIVEQEA